MFELTMPKMGESVAEATITEWLKNEGDTISADESILTIATDKVDSEVPSPVDGVLVKRLFNADDVIQVGQVIAHIQTDGDAAPAPVAEAAPTTSAPESPAPAAAEVAESIQAQGEATAKASDIPRESNGRFYSPLVRSIASAEGLSTSELDSIEGTGRDGRVSKADVLAYIANRGAAPAPAATPAAKPATQATTNTTIDAPSVASMAGDEIIEMDRMRKLIADHMVMSKHVSPHVTSFVEADVTAIWNWRGRVKDDFQKREGEKLTFTPIFMEAVIKAIKDFPLINISVDGTNIVKRKNINLGMATALPSGNLIVPVIKNADRFSLMGLAKEVNDLANRARNNALSPDDISGGTYTVTNVGTFGNVMGTPIINQPQVAILALGAIRKVPAVIETPEGDVIGIRYKMFLSHSYDHRVVDGALGGMFVRRVADYLEQWDPNREI